MLLVGNPALPLKAFPVALAALATVNQVSPIRVRPARPYTVLPLSPLPPPRKQFHL